MLRGLAEQSYSPDMAKKPEPVETAKLKTCELCGNISTTSCPSCGMKLCDRCKGRHPEHK